MTTIIIDIQGFKINKKTFIPKELAVLKNLKSAHYIFKPPFLFELLPEKFQKQFKWLVKNHHCIQWNVGVVPHYKLKDIIRDLTYDVTKIYVKGKEKAEFLKKITRKSIVELPESPALRSGLPECLYHCSEDCYCSLSNVKYLYEQFKDEMKK